MIKFLFKGLLRDQSRSRLPILVVAMGVMVTVFLQAYMSGVMSDSIESTANFTTGHLKVVTRANADKTSQTPADMTLMGVDKLKNSLQQDFPDIQWTDRIQFGGLLDVPDSTGQTRAQGMVKGMGIQLLHSQDEINRMNLKTSLVSGKFPTKEGEILLSNELFKKMKLQLGDEITLISSGMYGDMAMYNFRVSGTVHFGITMLDKGTMIADVSDVRLALNMEDGAGEILGFFKESKYDDSRALLSMQKFNAKQINGNTEPIMQGLSSDPNMAFFVAYADNIQLIIVSIFIFAMSIVLWNAGLHGALRRYGEFGLRLAIGESKNEIYVSVILESLLIGLVGSVIGVAFGLLSAWYMETYGINIGNMMKDATFMLPTVLRAHITTTTLYIGFLPGILSTVIGAMLAGIGIYKRQTANLFKELEN